MPTDRALVSDCRAQRFGGIGINIRYRIARLAVALSSLVFLLQPFTRNAAAQTEANAAIALKSEAYNPTDATLLAADLKSLRYDKLIAETTAALPDAAKAEDLWLLHYFRGCAYWHLGFLDEAEADMVAIGGGDHVPIVTYTTPRWFIETIELQKAHRPVHRHEVTVDGVAMFTVFADDEDSALRQILDLLPVAVNSVRHLTETDPHKTVVLVFHDLTRMKAYDDIPVKIGGMGCWAWAHASLSGVRVCPAGAQATPAPDLQGFYFRSTITHEYMHTAVDRILEDATPLPIWLSEGIADVAGSLSAPAAETRHAWRFSQVLMHQAILPLSTMSGMGYYEETQNQYAHNGLHDPYAQGHAMATYLLLGRPKSIVMSLLMNVKETHDFAQAFALTFGTSVDAFYKDWRGYIGQ